MASPRQWPSRFSYGIFSMEGEHHPNEDRFKVKPVLMEDSDGVPIFYAAIFDGHGGSLCAEYCKLNLHRNLVKQLKSSGNLADPELRDVTIVAALLNAFAKTEEDYLSLSIESNEFSGACANTIIIYKDSIYVANLGDCRAILMRNKGKAISLSRDHKASIEKERIRKVGGFVKNGRVNGVLAISRTIGDREFKDPVMLDETGSPVRSPGRPLSYRPGQSPKASVAKAPFVRKVSNPNNLLLRNIKDSSDSPRLKTRTLSMIDTPPTRALSPSPDTASTAPVVATETSESLLSPPAVLTKSLSDMGMEPKTTEMSPSKRDRKPSKSPSVESSHKKNISESESESSHQESPTRRSTSNTDPIPTSTKLKSDKVVKDGKEPNVDKRISLSQSGDSSVVAPSTAGEQTENTVAMSSDTPVSDETYTDDNLFDVIECFDPESKAKKFGFKKRIPPPKDPQAETATIVSAIPEITVMRRNPDDDCIFLASDGFFDYFTTKQAALTVNKHLNRSGRDKLQQVVKSLCEESATLGSEDDITGIIILLNPHKKVL